MLTRLSVRAGYILLALLSLAGPALADNHIPVAIIIDDLGYNHQRGVQAINLPAPLTYSVIPGSAHATALARYAHQSGKEVMVHLPMENASDQPLGKLALTSELDEEQVKQIVAEAMRLVPHAAGLNNHMGSSLTTEPQAMAWLMRAMKQHKLFFIDSRTTHQTVAKEVAQYEAVPSASRDVFLDNEKTELAVDSQFTEFLRTARQKKSAIAIGHPHPETLAYLAKRLPLLADEGFRLVPVSEILKLRIPQPERPTGEALSSLDNWLRVQSPL